MSQDSIIPGLEGFSLDDPFMGENYKKELYQGVEDGLTYRYLLVRKPTDPDAKGWAKVTVADREEGVAWNVTVNLDDRVPRFVVYSFTWKQVRFPDRACEFIDELTRMYLTMQTLFYKGDHVWDFHDNHARDTRSYSFRLKDELLGDEGPEETPSVISQQQAAYMKLREEIEKDLLSSLNVPSALTAYSEQRDSDDDDT